MTELYMKSVVMALREAGGVGPKMFQMLLSAYGSPENVYGIDISSLTDLPRVSEEKAEQILASQDMIQMMSERIERIRDDSIDVTTFVDDDYPAKLRMLDAPPPILYYRGRLPDPNQPAIGMIGATDATANGINATVQIATDLASRGVAVISGLARGIDASAHLGAIKGDGHTFAVLGSGLYNVYPEENEMLAKQISKDGCVITEYPPDTTVSTGRLLARNRIVVGLSDSVIITELAPESSGCRSAAEACDDQGKLLFYLLKGDEEKRGINVPNNVIPFQTIEDVQTILETSTRSC